MCKVNSGSDQPILIPNHLQATLHYLIPRDINNQTVSRRRKWLRMGAVLSRKTDKGKRRLAIIGYRGQSCRPTISSDVEMCIKRWRFSGK